MSERHVLVFAGAGLTKSLEQPGGPRVPLMSDFVACMADHVADDVILRGLRELEMSEAFAYKPAEARECARTIVEQSGPVDRPTRDEFKAVMQRRPAENIEDLLERASRNTKETDRKGLAERAFCEAIAQFFALVQPLDLSALRRFVSVRASERPASATYVSFNYDLSLDCALQDVAGWHPMDGYGETMNWVATAELQTYMDGASFEGNGSVPELSPKKFASSAIDSAARVTLLKPHGSVNWWAPVNLDGGAGDLNPTAEPPYVTCMDASGKLTYLHRPGTFPYPAVDAGEQAVVPLIVAPCSESKKGAAGFLKRLRDKERDAVRAATDVYVIGWSMPKTDEDQRALIRDNVAQRERPIERLVVINYGAGPDYYRDVADTFGVELACMEVFNNGFTEYVKQHCRDAAPSA